MSMSQSKRQPRYRLQRYEDVWWCRTQLASVRCSSIHTTSPDSMAAQSALTKTYVITVRRSPKQSYASSLPSDNMGVCDLSAFFILQRTSSACDDLV